MYIKDIYNFLEIRNTVANKSYQRKPPQGKIITFMIYNSSLYYLYSIKTCLVQNFLRKFLNKRKKH